MTHTFFTTVNCHLIYFLVLDFYLSSTFLTPPPPIFISTCYVLLGKRNKQRIGRSEMTWENSPKVSFAITPGTCGFHALTKMILLKNCKLCLMIYGNMVYVIYMRVRELLDICGKEHNLDARYALGPCVRTQLKLNLDSSNSVEKTILYHIFNLENIHHLLLKI